MKPKVAVVRGKFLNKYEMQFYEPLTRQFRLTGFGSLTPFHDQFAFPVVKLPSPMDLPEFPYKMPMLNRLFIDAQYLFGLENKLRGFDLVHTAETYYHYTQQCLNAKRKGYVKKVIATVLENIPFNNEGIWGRKEYKKRAREELDHIIALTNKTKEALLAEGADPKKITVISHFVDTKRFAPSTETMNRRRSAKRVFNVLFTGRLEEYKGVLDILSAAEKLSKDADLTGYRIHWMFVGNGSLKSQMLKREKLSGLTANHNSVGYDQMPAVYSKADIFIAPSKPTKTYDEQYCTALLEAQAAGLPIVTTNTGGIPENIGNAGVLVAPGDVDAMSYTIKEYILIPTIRTSYAVKARRRAETVHDITIGAGKLTALYHELLS